MPPRKRRSLSPPSGRAHSRQRLASSAAATNSHVPRVGSQQPALQAIAYSQLHANVKVDNAAFHSALQNHIQRLTTAERAAFSNGNNISPHSLLAGVRKLDNEHRQRSTSRACAERIEGFLGVLDGYLKGLSICIQQSPEISSLVVGGIKLVVDIWLRFARFFTKLTEMMENIGEHLGYLSQYSEHFAQSDDVKRALCDAYSDLLEFCKNARKIFTDSDGRPRRWASFRVGWKILWIPFEASFETINTRFHQHVDIVLRTAGIAELQRRRRIEGQEAQEKEDRERGEILSWLSKIDFDQDHDRIFTKRHGDSGSWLVNSSEFQQWIHASKSCLLWCYGNPGVGKSVLASLIVETISERYCMDDRVGMVFAYFNYQEQNIQTPANILATLTKQLCRQVKNLPDQLKGLYKQCLRDAKTPSLATLEEVFVGVTTAFDEVFLVFDAMDECGAKERRLVLPYLQKLVGGSTSRLKVFVTSRREGDIERSFTSGGFDRLEIEAKNVDADIITFINHQLTHEANREARCTLNQALKDTIAKTLALECNGMFLWVQCQLQYIYEQPTSEDIIDALKSLPHDMNTTYLRILREIDGQVPAIKVLARRALMWVLTASRPLSIGELANAVAIEPTSRSIDGLKKYTLQTILAACGNLLSSSGGFIRPIHYTVKEFFTANELDIPTHDQSLYRRYLLTQFESHWELAERCIQFLLFDTFGDLSDDEIDEYVYQAVDSLLRYAPTGWGFHANSIPAELPHSLSSMIDTLLDTEGASNLLLVYAFTAELSGCHSFGTINRWTFCLTAGLFQFLPSLDQHGSKGIELPHGQPLLHYAAQGGSLLWVQKLLEVGYSAIERDDTDVQPLYYAALLGHSQLIVPLLDAGADINGHCGPAGSALQVACNKGHENVVWILLAKGADVNAPGPTPTDDHFSPVGHALLIASSNGYAEIVQILLQNGADVECQRVGPYSGDTNPFRNALGAASYRGHQDVVQMLLDHGADVNGLGGYFGSALQAAVVGRHTEVSKMLLDNGASIHDDEGPYGNIMIAASHRGNTELVNICLSKGLAVNSPGSMFCTALQAAAACGSEEIFRVLLQNGGDVTAQGGMYGSTLQAAASVGSEEIVNMLLEKGADVNARGGRMGSAIQAASHAYSKPGNTPSHDLVHLRIIATLLNHGADINTKGGSHGSALQGVCQKWNKQAVRMMLDNGADINAQGGVYGNALQAATMWGTVEVVQVLLGHGADINAQGGLYGNALQAGAGRGAVEVVQVLLDHGADINAQGGKYGNALQAASYQGAVEVVQVLLEHGADINAQGGEYGNALQAASYRGTVEVVQVLLEHGADINAHGGEYGNALQAASYRGAVEVVQALLEHGADINAQGGRLRNAITAAQAARSPRDCATLVAVLLAWGAKDE